MNLKKRRRFTFKFFVILSNEKVDNRRRNTHCSIRQGVTQMLDTHFLIQLSNTITGPNTIEDQKTSSYTKKG